jgi:GNAT superfamily N-acetyltransferase
VNLQVDSEHDDDPGVLKCMVLVRAEHRRSGVGSRLLAEVLEIARSEGRIRLIGRSWDAIPAGEHFAAAMRATAVSRTHTNHLPLAGIDRALLEQWVADAPTRAPGYELVAWDGPIPEEHLDAFVDLMLVMNDAPKDDADLNDFTLTPQRWREAEQQGREQGHQRWTLIAKTTGGTLAGLHDITWVPALPGVAFIGSTGVRPEHRGFALGKWLKAAMTLRVLDERPDATEIRTDNADSNAAMLGINQQMGYRPMLGSVTWQVGVDEAAAVLSERSNPTS